MLAMSLALDGGDPGPATLPSGPGVSAASRGGHRLIARGDHLMRHRSRVRARASAATPPPTPRAHGGAGGEPSCARVDAGDQVKTRCARPSSSASTLTLLPADSSRALHRPPTRLGRPVPTLCALANGGPLEIDSHAPSVRPLAWNDRPLFEMLIPRESQPGSPVPLSAPAGELLEGLLGLSITVKVRARISTR